MTTSCSGTTALKSEALSPSSKLPATKPVTSADKAVSETSSSLPKNDQIGITSGFKGVEFNPQVKHATWSGYGFPYFQDYKAGSNYRTQLRAHLEDLSRSGFNFITVWLCNLHTMKNPREIANSAGQPLAEWANFTCLDNFALFLDDCYAAGINVEIDLVDNRWIPYQIDSANHIGQPGGWWPVADDTPWEEAAAWYTQVIEYVESKTKRPEVIAMWTMMGNYHWGAAEPVLWDNEPDNSVVEWTEKFVKYCWPKFVEAGNHPKGSPFMLPIYDNGSYWSSRTPLERLSAFTNLHKWLVSDLNCPPDYWLMSTGTYSDPAGDGFPYLAKIKEIVTKDNNAKIISTDFGMPARVWSGTICDAPDKSRKLTDMIEWNLRKCAEYGFAGYWIWQYQEDGVSGLIGLKDLDGSWKPGVLEAINAKY